jgi:hypothetical protein
MDRSLRKIVWLWYALNVITATAIALPLILTGAAFLGPSGEKARLFENFDLSWITEFGYSANFQQFLAWAPVAGLMGGAFVLLTTFLSGGTLAVIEDREASFFGACARWFPPFLRLLLISLFLYAIAFAIRGLINRGFRKLFPDEMSGKPAAIESFLAFVLLVGMVCFVNMVFDYAKIHLVTLGHRKAWRATGQALRFVFANLGPASCLYGTLFLFGLLMLAVYHVWSEAVGQSSGLAVFALLLIRQVYLYFRTRLRVTFLDRQYALFGRIDRSLRPVHAGPAPAIEPDARVRVKAMPSHPEPLVEEEPLL